MKKIVCFVVGAIISSITYAVAPSVEGSWMVTFYLENSRSIGATQCVDFKLVPGRVAGVPTSGVWSSPTFPGWSGEWVQLGDHVRWFGITGSLATTESGNISHNSRFAGVSFNHYSTSSRMTASAGSWLATRARSCSGLMENMNATREDPAKRIN